MKTIRSVAELRAALSGPRRQARRIGLVPTMGALHEGHLSLIRRARTDSDIVVVSVFVNPAQFDEQADLAAYPRDEERDAAMAAELGVDFLFVPGVEEIYPAGFATTVSVGGLTETLEGARRGRAHFDGVTTVVTKLFNIVGPDIAYFGQKDFQQALVIKRLVRDLNLPIIVEVCPTVREHDGLALSSRNMHLSSAERSRAAALHRALSAAGGAVSAGVADAEEVKRQAAAELEAAGLEPEYLAVVSAETLAPVERIDGNTVALVAARVGKTRLIDNHPLAVPSTVTANENGSS